VIIGMADVYYAYNGLLCTLQVLHCIWFYMILRMVYFYVFKGEVRFSRYHLITLIIIIVIINNNNNKPLLKSS